MLFGLQDDDGGGSSWHPEDVPASPGSAAERHQHCGEGGAAAEGEHPRGEEDHPSAFSPFSEISIFFLAYENMSIMSTGLSQLLKNRVHPGLFVHGKTNSNGLGLGLGFSVILSHKLC